MTDYKFGAELPILADKFRSYESPVGYPFNLIKWCRHEADIADDPNGDKPITEKIFKPHTYKVVKEMMNTD